MARTPNWPPVPRPFRGQDRVFWNGRYHYLGPVGSAASRAELGRLVSLWAADPTAGSRPSGERPVAELFRDYLASPDAPPAGDQRVRVKRAAGLLLEHHLTTAVAEFDGPMLEAWQRWLCDQRHPADHPSEPGGRRWTRTYILDLVQAVVRVFRWAARRRLATWDRVQELAAVPGPKYGTVKEGREVLAADPAAVAKVMPHLPAAVRGLAEVEALTGARPNELCQLTAESLLRTGRVQVPRVGWVDLDAEGVWLFTPPQHKKLSRRKPRWLLFGAKAQAVLAPLLAACPVGGYVFSPARAEAERLAQRAAARKTPKYPSHVARNTAKRPDVRKRPPAEVYTPASYRRAVERACAKAGVGKLTPYQLRHLFALNVDAQMDTDYAQAALGHDKPDTTRIYTKRSFKKAAEVARKMG